jgi:hypothetical protein
MSGREAGFSEVVRLRNEAAGKGCGQDLLIQSIIKGSEHLSRTPRMASITEGVIELQQPPPSWEGLEERFEAAVQTSEGPKKLEGTVRGHCACLDLQLGRVDEWRVELQRADQAIRRAYEDPDPRKGLKFIAAVWEELHKTSELAAARSRILLGKLKLPQLAPTPNWFEDQKDTLSEVDHGELAANPLAVASTELLIRAVVAAIGDAEELRAEVDIGPAGRVLVDWLVPGIRLQWLVEATDTPWPSAKVYQLSYPIKGTLQEPPNTRVLYNAFDVVDSFRSLVRD